jgi:YesN/AraC family two-component response regulator
VLTDIRMPEMTGITLMEKIHEAYPEIRSSS